MNINNFYTSIIKYCGFTIDENNKIIYKVNDKQTDIIVNDLPLYLPNDALLKDSSGKSFFHPLTEKIVRGVSEVLVRLTTGINLKLNTALNLIFNSLLLLALNKEYQNKLNVTQKKLLIYLKEIEPDIIEVYNELWLKGVSLKGGDRALINIYLQRTGTVNGEPFSRVGVVYFPLYEEIKKALAEANKKKTVVIWDKKVNIKHLEIILKIHKFIFPEIDNEDAYYKGSINSVAPFLDAMLKVSYGIVEALLSIKEIYNEYIIEDDCLIFNTDWLDIIDDYKTLQSFYRCFPSQPGNEGSELQENNVGANINQEVFEQVAVNKLSAPVIQSPQSQNSSVQLNQNNNQPNFNNINQQNSYSQGYVQNTIPNQPQIQTSASGGMEGLMRNIVKHNQPNYNQGFNPHNMHAPMNQLQEYPNMNNQYNRQQQYQQYPHQTNRNIFGF